MSDRVLVAYATRTGSTAGVATAISEALTERGFVTDAKAITEHPEVSGYDAVVIGSAVQGGKWLPEALEFVHANAGALSRRPVGLSCVHALFRGDNDKDRARRVSYLDAVRPLVPNADEA